MRYTGESCTEVSFPLGGIGTGSIGLSGCGHLVDWEIRNRPDKGSLNGWSGFLIRAEYEDGTSEVRVLQGDYSRQLSGQYQKARFCGFGFGPASSTYAALPHFETAVFDGTFPTASVTLTDKDFPADVTLGAWSPFIPLDSENSSIPCANFDIRIRPKREGIRYTVAAVITNPFDRGLCRDVSEGGLTTVRLDSFCREEDAAEYGDVCLSTDAENAVVQEYWYRGRWQDGISAFWDEISRGKLTPRRYTEPLPAGNDTSVIAAETDGREAIRFTITWNVPNNRNDWEPYNGENGKPVTWKNYYATRFPDSLATARYVFANREDLQARTASFRDALFSVSLDPVIVDAVASSLSVLRSPTVWRLENGAFYGWEGVHEKQGSCEGTCTHVWSYAYALCFLFPDLERSIRETEFAHDVYENGQMRFRTKLPLSRPMPKDPWLPCLDGQMATVIKCCRDCRITGNVQWVKENWDTIRKLLCFAWSEQNRYEWDRDRDGVLEGRQHHTLDMELFGPSAWLEGMYLAALKAGRELALLVGDPDSAGLFEEIYEKGRAYTDASLFNGSYYVQKTDLHDKAPAEHFNCPEYWNDERGELKYQIADGCEIDQLLGQWHATLCGLGDIFDREKRRTALASMFRNNFKPKLRAVANLWRVFALNDEGGAIMCDYPEGTRKPVIPIPYCEECMTGFEYAFAGLLMSEKMTEQAETVVRAIRDRYDGKKRNPYNEIECGSNYARAMASFALLPLSAGFSYDLTSGLIGFDPVYDGDFCTLWSLGTGWGTFERKQDRCTLSLRGGTLPLSRLLIGGFGKIASLTIDGRRIPFAQNGDLLTFRETTVTASAVLER